MIIRGGLVALPGEAHPVMIDIRVDKGMIVELGFIPDDKIADDDVVINARGKFVMPGGIDPHVHFKDPGFTYQEDFLTGTSFAASGGITTVIDMPCTSIPPVTNRENLKKKLEVVKKKAITDFGFFGGVSSQSINEGFPENLIDMADLILGVKTYLISGMESFGHLDHYLLKTVLQATKFLHVPVLIHAEDFSYVNRATEMEKQIGNAPINYYNSRPETAEILAIMNAYLLVREVESDVHIVHVGTASAASIIDNDFITGETCPHYLEFSLDDFEKIGSPLKITPPIKSSTNAFDLWGMIRNRTLSFLASDHATCTKEEKNTGSIWTDYSGNPGSGLLLPFAFSEGYTKNLIDLPTLVEITSTAAAERYQIDNKKGSIEIGKDADFAIIDPDLNWTIKGEDFLSKGKITPFEGREFVGSVIKTILRGKLIYDHKLGILADPGYGEFITQGAR
ncbi:MAG: dihydroorotase [Candidatus Zixiibacteriota bacterium]